MNKNITSIDISELNPEQISILIEEKVNQGYVFMTIYSYWGDIEMFNTTMFVVDDPNDINYVYLEK